MGITRVTSATVARLKAIIAKTGGANSERGERFCFHKLTSKRLRHRWLLVSEGDRESMGLDEGNVKRVGEAGEEIGGMGFAIYYIGLLRTQ